MATKPCAEKCSPRSSIIATDSLPFVTDTSPLLAMENEDDCNTKLQQQWHHIAVSRKSGRGRSRGKGGGRTKESPLPEPPPSTEVTSSEVTDCEASSAVLGCLTRGARQRLSLPLMTPTALGGENKLAVKIACKRRASDMFLGEHFDYVADGDNNNGVGYTTSSLSVVKPDKVTENGSMETDHNTNARRRQKKRQKSAKLQNAGSAQTPRLYGRPPTTTHMVNFSALRPISAMCSQSGMGLVVTYRPCFSETIKPIKKRAKRQSRVNAHQKGNKTKCFRDSATSPRSPSPEKGRLKRSRSPSFFSRVLAGITQDNTEKGHGVKPWMDDHPRSPRIKKHRSPSPTRDKTCNKTGMFGRGRSPIPGPSWAPDELTCPPRSKSNSPASFGRGGSPRLPGRPRHRRRCSRRRSPRRSPLTRPQPPKNCPNDQPHYYPLGPQGSPRHEHEDRSTYRPPRYGPQEPQVSRRRSPRLSRLAQGVTAKRAARRPSPRAQVAAASPTDPFGQSGPDRHRSPQRGEGSSSSLLPLAHPKTRAKMKEVYGHKSPRPSPDRQQGKRRSASSSPQPNPVVSEGWNVDRSSKSHSSSPGSQPEYHQPNVVGRRVSASPRRTSPTRVGNFSRWRPPDENSIIHTRHRAMSRSRSASPTASFSENSVMSRDVYDTERDYPGWYRHGERDHRRRCRPQHDREDLGDKRKGTACHLM